MMCTAHPAKGDLKEFPGLTAEEEDHQKQCARAQLACILYERPRNYLHFSKPLMKYADREFLPSPPSTPKRKRKRPAPRPKAAASTASDPENDEEEEPPPSESRNFADMASFWDQEDD